MKKILAIITAVGFALCLGACGAAEDMVEVITSPAEGSAEAEAIKNNLADATAYVESVIDTDDMTVQTDDEDPGYVYTFWTYEEFPGNVELSTDIEIDGKKITLGKTTVKELEELDFDMEKISDTIGPDEVVTVSLHQGSKMNVLELMPNYTGETLPVDDFAVAAFSCGTAEYTLPFNFSGLTQESTLEDALKIFGTPNEEIHVSADSVGTIICLRYVNSIKEETTVTNDRLEIDYLFDPASGTTSFYGAVRSRDVQPAEAE